MICVLLFEKVNQYFCLAKDGVTSKIMCYDRFGKNPHAADDIQSLSF